MASEEAAVSYWRRIAEYTAKQGVFERHAEFFPITTKLEISHALARAAWYINCGKKQGEWERYRFTKEVGVGWISTKNFIGTIWFMIDPSVEPQRLDMFFMTGCTLYKQVYQEISESEYKQKLET